jgi:glutamyl-tRNA synthetase
MPPQTQPRTPYRGRFAPSPTGNLHLGLARTALLGYLRARSQGGTFLVRLEDLDAPRVAQGSAEALLEDLRWLGLDWDEGPDVGGAFGPYVQSARLERYAEAVALLSARARTYACSCSRKDIQIASAPHGPSDFGAVYPGTCRDKPPRAEPRCATRFVVPEPLPSFEDGLCGAVAPSALGDFVIRRADGVFSYQLAVVVDDIAMQVSEVLRGADLARCTAWQIALYQALGAPVPAFVHVPLLLGPDGKRLAKRDGAVAIRDYRERGLRPDALVGWLAASAGLVPVGTRAMPRDLIADFTLARVSRQASRLTADALLR